MDTHRCYGCMQTFEGDICPHCGRPREKECVDEQATQLPGTSALESQPVSLKPRKKIPLRAMLCAIIIPVVLALCAGAFFLLKHLNRPRNDIYDDPEDPRNAICEEARALISSGDYGTAYPLLVELAGGGHRGAAELLEGYKWVETEITTDTAYVTYDYRGNMLLTEKISEAGYLVVFEMEYDDQGRMIRQDYRDSNPEQPYSSTNLYSYDEQGRCVLMEFTSSNGFPVEYFYEYDAEDRVTKEVSKIGDAVSVMAYTYSVSKGGAHTRTDITINEKPYRLEERRRDDGGRLVYSRDYYYQNGDETTITYEYDDNGNVLVHRYEYDNKSRDEFDTERTRYYSYLYDEDDRILSMEYRDTEGVEYVREYFYNAYGAVCRMEDTYPDGTVKVTEHTLVLTYNGEKVPGY